MPVGATPDSHIPSGPWCFAGQEDRFPDWDDAGNQQRFFPLPPDPFANAEAVDLAAKEANGAALQLIEHFGKRYNMLKKTSLSGRFWHMALGPFLLLAAHMLAERQKRVLDLVALYENKRLRVPLLPADIPFAFADSPDFMIRGVQNVYFNHYVFSRIVEAVAPPQWHLVYQPAPRGPEIADDDIKVPLRIRCRARLRHRLLTLPFPYMKGFRPWQTMLLSLAVLQNKRTRQDQSLDFSLYCREPLVWRFPAEALISAWMPESIRKASLPGNIQPPREDRPGPLRGMSPVYSQDDAYRLHLASLLEQGCRLFAVQHGANYGNLQSIGGLPFEYSRHAFYTWGWDSHESAPSNAVPLPHPTLVSIAGAHKERERSLILVGTEMSTFSYRLKSRPQAKALLAYRAAKLEFLRSAAQNIGETGTILYRPYFKTAGGLDDAAHVLRRLPQTGICTGDLTRHILGCRLLVLDHYGTTLHMALAADVPTLAFWKTGDWGFDRESTWACGILREAGILFETPQEAAARATEIWPDVAGWWRNNVIQSARKLWMTRYARTGDSPERPWSGLTLIRRWFSALLHC